MTARTSRRLATLQIAATFLVSGFASMATGQVVDAQANPPLSDQEVADINMRLKAIADPDPPLPAPSSNADGGAADPISDLIAALPVPPRPPVLITHPRTSENWVPFVLSGKDQSFVDTRSFSRKSDRRTIGGVSLGSDRVTYRSKMIIPSERKRVGLEYAIIDHELDCDKYTDTVGRGYGYYISGDVLEFYAGGGSNVVARPGSRSYDLILYACDDERVADVNSIPAFPVDWFVVRTQPNGMTWSIERSSMGKVHPTNGDDRIWFWSRKDFSKVLSVKFRYIYLLQGIDCQSRDMKTTMTITNMPNEEAGVLETTYNTSSIPPSSSEEAVFEEICRTTNVGLEH